MFTLRKVVTPQQIFVVEIFQFLYFDVSFYWRSFLFGTIKNVCCTLSLRLKFEEEPTSCCQDIAISKVGSVGWWFRVRPHLAL